MKSRSRAAIFAVMLALPLGACTTSGTSSHGGLSQHNQGKFYTRDGVIRHAPQSDHASLKGDSSNRLLELGKESFADQNYGLSEKYFREAVAVRTDNISAWAGLAASYDQLGRFDLADRAYKALVDLKGEDPRILNNIGYSFLLRGDYKKARKYLNKAQTLNPALDEVQGNLHLLEKIASS